MSRHERRVEASLERSRARSVHKEFRAIARAAVELANSRAWPAVRWQKDPVGFAEAILGVQLSPFQVEFLEGIRDHDRVAIAGGRKIGKDFAVAVACLWWYACFPHARVFITATTARQVQGILWLQIRQLYARSGRCFACRTAGVAKSPCVHSLELAGKMGEQSHTGLRATDFRSIEGWTAKHAEEAAGYSGPCVMIVVDEASLVTDAVHTSWRGNLGGCEPGFGKEVLISNPTRLSGFFFDAFHSKSALYWTRNVSSLTSPNYITGRSVFPGQATRAWVEEQRQDWGEGSPLWVCHVEGKFPTGEKGKPFTVHALEESASRYDEMHEEGRLHIGVDVAGESDEEQNDESAFAGRRGLKVMHLFARRGMSPEAHLVEVLGIIAKYPTPGEDPPRVVLDRGGAQGAKVWGVFVAYREDHPDAFELVGVFPSDRALRKPQTYDRVRDELVASAADWMRDGGAIPADAKLQRELNSFQWEEQTSGRSKLVHKRVQRRELGRSPDRADAFALSCWGSKYVAATATTAETRVAPAAPVVVQAAAIDPRVAAATSTGDPYALFASVNGRR